MLGKGRLKKWSQTAQQRREQTVRKHVGKCEGCLRMCSGSDTSSTAAGERRKATVSTLLPESLSQWWDKLVVERHGENTQGSWYIKQTRKYFTQSKMNSECSSWETVKQTDTHTRTHTHTHTHAHTVLSHQVWNSPPQLLWTIILMFLPGFFETIEWNLWSMSRTTNMRKYEEIHYLHFPMLEDKVKQPSGE